MRARRFFVLGVAVATMLATPTAALAAPGHEAIPSAVPPAFTPAIEDGQVNDIVQVGSTMVAGGTFTQVTPPGGATVGRQQVVAFDATSGALRAFNPSVNGNVEAVLEGPTAGTVYIAGSFTTVNGVAAPKVALLNATTGASVSGFRAPATNGVVNALAKAGNRLLIGGTFSTVGGAAHRGFASISPTTGALDPYMNAQVDGRHNDSGSGAQGAIGVREMETTSDGSTLIAIGNFKRVDGLTRDQAVKIDLGPSGATVDADWRTRRYEPYCFNWAFDSYMRGLTIAPDDSYFAISTTGGQNAGSLCDTAARFEMDGTGDDVQPTWIDYSGGDTLWGIEATETAVYVGGHQRWMNNSNGSDFAGQGAVPRAGLAALDVDSGLPISWNPGRNPRGAAVFAIYATPAGLWLGSDTFWIGDRDYRRPRLAFFPMAGGSQQHPETVANLPGDVYLGGGTGISQGNIVYRVNAGGGEIASLDGGPAWTADSGATSPYRNSNSNAAGWASGASVDGTIPPTTPNAIFDTERWSPNDNPAMNWDFPVTAGAPLQVRLYFANRCTCTSSPGQRSFDVRLDGNLVMDDFDIAATVGDQRGTMRAFDITSDGNVDIDFAHVVENPLVNAIEIVRTDVAPPSPDTSLSTIDYDGSSADPRTPANARGIDWSRTRGAFMVGDTLFYGQADGALYRRTLTAGSTGDAQRIDPYNDPKWSTVDSGSNSTFRGAVPSLYGQMPNVTGLTYANDRIYYTLNNDGNLYWRWFNADSGIIGSQVFTANGGRSWTDTGGLFVDGDDLYVVSKATGNLQRMGFGATGPSGALQTADTTNDWRARSVFIGPGSPPANQPPTAAFDTECTFLSCTLDASGSDDPDGSIAEYAWSFGDAQTGSGETTSHTYDDAGTYTITLTVTDDDGAMAQTTREVEVEEAPPTESDVSFVGQSTEAFHSAAPVVSVPGSVQAGDQLVLVGNYGLSTSVQDPSGWTRVGERDANGMSSVVWTRRAVAGDAGAPVTTTLPSRMKASLALGAYRGVAAEDAVAAIQSATASSTTSHTGPTATAPAGAWAVQAWGDKSSATTSWTAPGGVTTRGVAIGAGAGRVSALLTDAGPVSAGTVGGGTATTDASSGRSISWTIVLRSGDGSVEPPPPPPPPPASDVSFVDESAEAFHSATPVVSVPGSVQAGDQLVLVGNYGLSTSVQDPSGWTRVGERDANGMSSVVWTRRAVAGDAGAPVTTTLPSRMKASLALGAYRGVAAEDAVAAIQSATASSTTSHTGPTATAPAGAWAVQAWGDKSSATTSWTAPGGVTTRGVAIGAGAGRVSALLTDAGPVSAGTVGGGTATTDASSGRSISWTIVLRPSA